MFVTALGQTETTWLRLSDWDGSPYGPDALTCGLAQPWISALAVMSTRMLTV